MITTKDSEKLERLIEPFLTGDIGKLPKPTKKQTDDVKRDFKQGSRCNICGGWHHPSVIHLDYVGHAALTKRMLEVDPKWFWEPLAYDDSGLPALDKDGLLWIKLSIAGVTRLGVGDAGSKTGGDAMKERVGDALRNAGMRFGMALELWHKGEFAKQDMPEQQPAPVKKMLEASNKKMWDSAIEAYKRDGNFDTILKRVGITKENQDKIKEAASV